MKLTFLSADKRLTKSFVFADGSYDSTPYPLTSDFTSHEEVVNSIEDFFAVVVAHAGAGHCVLKGGLSRPITRESRAGLMVSEQTLWLVLDFDGLDPENKTVDQILAEIGLPNVDYILQYSASHGIKKGLNAHIFIMLQQATSPDELKRWLKWKNLNVPFLRKQIKLTNSKMALHWPLDITVCQNDKLIYIAPPNISGAEDPVGERTILVKRDLRFLELGPAGTGVDEQATELVKQLRSAEGLPDHKFNTVVSTKFHVEITKNPEQVSVTGVKRHGPFTYLNINGGDSWGYYFPTAQPDVLFNFKGEPNYLLKDIAPSFYKDAVYHAKQHKADQHRPKECNGKPKHWVINHRDEGRYYKVSYTPGDGIVLSPAPTMKHIADFCVAHNILIPEHIEDWTVSFDPTTEDVVDAEQRRINLYRPTIYQIRSKERLRNQKADAARMGYREGTGDSGALGIYLKLFKHVCGGDDEATERFVNWLAFVWQTGRKPGTAWVFHGTYGTGKGRIALILDKLLGPQFNQVQPETVVEQFNAILETTQILWIDEVTTDAWDNAKMTPKLRFWITEDRIPIRGMRKDVRTVTSFTAFIVSANEYNPVEIRKSDRRWNVAPRQEAPLLSLPWATDELLDKEHGSLVQDDWLHELAFFLAQYPVDLANVRIPLYNEAKEKLMQVTQNLPEDIVAALLGGDVAYFLEYVPSPNGIPDLEGAKYKEVVAKMMAGGRVPLRTSDIRTIFQYLAGWKQSPGKFNKALSNFGLDLRRKSVREGDAVVAGMAFDFNVTEAAEDMWRQLNQAVRLQVVGRESRENGNV